VTDREPNGKMPQWGWTLGVEEEFLLVDPRWGFTLPAAPAILAHVADSDLPPGAAIRPELRPSQIEATTGICRAAGQLREQLTGGRRALAGAGRTAGVLVVPVGTPPVAPGTADRLRDGHGSCTDDTRYARIDQLYAGVTRDYEACGLHVHVGVPDKDHAVAVVNHVNRWLPVLLALSVNSPLHAGRDTGYGSWRIVQQSRFPGSGLAPYADGYPAWEAEIARLVDCGVLADAGQTFWFARPSPRLPTVEFRVADTAASVDDAVLQGLLSRALVRTALAELERGREALPTPATLAEAAVWTAARYGLSGCLIDLALGVRTPATALLGELFAHLSDALDDTGDREEVRTLLHRPQTSGAQRQRTLASAAGVSEVPRLMSLSSSDSRLDDPNSGTPAV
jgi:carboxylate-amine ligase